MNKTTYINQLPQATQEAIKNDIFTALIEMKRSMHKSELEDAMNGRLCDLEDIININKYL